MIRSSTNLRIAHVDADVCVIGAGAAGLTLARELAGSSLRVCLVESGERAPPLEHDPLYEVRYTRLKISHDSRTRGLGGTTQVWAGRWKRFDRIDLEHRDWIPHASWPITYDELAPYYERAAAAIGLREDPGYATDGPALLRGEVVVPAVFHTQPKPDRNWGVLWGSMLEQSENIDAWLGLHVMALEHSGRAVTRLVCRTADGRRVTVAAEAVVVATGGIENARLLLISRLGNEHDQVGRYFMDHPRAKVGVIETYVPIDYALLRGLTEGAPSYLGYRLCDDVQRTERVLNSHIFFAPELESSLAWRLVHAVAPPRSCRILVVRQYMEQVPDPDNRVFLVDEPDPYGLPRAGVAWTVGALDHRTMVVFHRHLQAELRRARIGELHSPMLRDPPVLPEVRDASHHTGATRMGADPRTSVVDKDCRLHAMDNVFVAGSSVFPTSGYANPNATIAALAIRLADRLRAGR